MGKTYRGSGRLNLIWEQGVGIRQKLEAQKTTNQGAGRMIKIKEYRNPYIKRHSDLNTWVQ